MPLLSRFLVQPLTLLFAATLVASALISGMVFFQYHHQSQNSHSQHYGQALANLAARQAVDATLNHDLVSLQVILSDVTSNPEVIGATIHDVENRLLVQSGHQPKGSPANTEYQRRATAPITLHNSVAGYVTVTLNLEERQQLADQLYTKLGSWLAALLAISLTGLYFWQRLKPEAETITTPTAGPAPLTRESLLSNEQGESEPAIQHSTRLHLELHNLNRLRSQLNSERFNELLSRFEQQLQGILAIYNGTHVTLHGESLCIDFPGDNRSDCSFRALCSAQLILSLAVRSEGPQLHPSATIGLPPSSTNLAAQFQAQHTTEATPPLQVFIAPELLDDELTQRIEYSPHQQEPGGRLEQFNSPYRELVARQEQQLLAL